jgi:hypothetical protein
MSGAELFLAGPADEAGLRALLRALPTGGAIRLAAGHDPDFFAALEVEGRDPVVVSARDAAGRLVVAGVSTWREVYLDGAPATVGYLGGLRIDPRHRGEGLLKRGFELARGEHARRPARLFLSSIIEDNLLGRRVLEGDHPGLPRFAPLGGWGTLTYAPRGDPWRARAGRGVEVAPADAAGLEPLVAFWQSEGPRRQFFPVQVAEELRASAGRLRGLAPGDVLVARQAGRVVGTLGLWDQRPFRQVVVAGYSRPLALARPLYNAFAAATRRPRLPPPGGVLDLRLGALLCVEGDRPEVLAALLSASWRTMQASSPEALLSIGVHERDPNRALLESAPHKALRSRLYVAHWPEGAAAFAALGNRCPHLELGSL